MNNQNSLPLQAANITIKEPQILEWGVKIKDEKGLVYNVPQYKKGTTTPTTAYTSLMAFGNYGVGKQVCVKFVVVPNQAGGESRYARIIGEPEEIDNQIKSVNNSFKEPVYKKEDTDWDVVNAKKELSMRFMNGLNNATMLACYGKIEVGEIEIKANEIAGYKQGMSLGFDFNKVKDPADSTSNYADVPHVDDIDVENIPF